VQDSEWLSDKIAMVINKPVREALNIGKWQLPWWKDMTRHSWYQLWDEVFIIASEEYTDET